MKGSYKADLRVNRISVEMNAFVEEFLARTALGLAGSLQGAEEIQGLEIHQEKGNVKITVNGNAIPLTAFPNDIICNTLTGLVSSLQDVDAVDSFNISVEVR